MKKFAIIAACAVLALGVLCCAAGCGGAKKEKLIDKTKLQVATHPGYQGFEELRDDGTYYGLDIEISQMIADELGVELVIQNMDFDSVVPSVKAGTKADMGAAGITINDDRKKEITFSEPYYYDNQAIVVQDATKYTKENYAADLNKEGVVIFCQTGTSGEAYAQENFPNATIKNVPDIGSLFTTLSTGQCDAVVQNAAPARNIVKNFSNLTIIDTVATGEEYGLAMNQQNQELIDQVNALIKKWKADGTLDKLCEKYNV